MTTVRPGRGGAGLSRFITVAPRLPAMGPAGIGRRSRAKGAR
jgi:hypothetical protein